MPSSCVRSPRSLTGAQSIRDNPPKFNSHIRIVRVTDPDRDGLHAAQSTTDDYYKTYTLVRMVRALPATDPDGVARLIADAECTAQSKTDDSLKASVLASIAEALAATGLDPEPLFTIERQEGRWRSLTQISKSVRVGCGQHRSLRLLHFAAARF